MQPTLEKLPNLPATTRWQMLCSIVGVEGPDDGSPDDLFLGTLGVSLRLFCSVVDVTPVELHALLIATNPRWWEPVLRARDAARELPESWSVARCTALACQFQSTVRYVFDVAQIFRLTQSEPRRAFSGPVFRGALAALLQPQEDGVLLEDVCGGHAQFSAWQATLQVTDGAASVAPRSEPARPSGAAAAEAVPPRAPGTRRSAGAASAQDALPIAAFRSEIVTAVQGHRVTFVVGETGCGKSTQVPKFLMEAGARRICTTQPRRIAAKTLAGRVAQERGEAVGDAVGYVRPSFQGRARDLVAMTGVWGGCHPRPCPAACVPWRYMAQKRAPIV